MYRESKEEGVLSGAAPGSKADTDVEAGKNCDFAFDVGSATPGTGEGSLEVDVWDRSKTSESSWVTSANKETIGSIVVAGAMLVSSPCVALPV